MEWIKTCLNTEFDVLYDDGTRSHVPEGVLFEANGEKMVLHLGTRRAEVLFAVAECLTEAIIAMDLGDAFERYIENAPEETDEGGGGHA